MTRLRLAALLAAMAAAPAVEMQLADLRFSAGIAPLPDKAEGVYTSVTAAPPGVGNGSTRVDTYEQDAMAFAADISATYGRLAPVGLIYGGSLRYCNGEMQLESIAYPSAGFTDTAAAFEAQGYEVPSNTWMSIGLAAHAGVGWAITDAWHVEAVGILGVDWLTLDTFSAITGSTQTYANEGSGPGWTWGGRAGVFWTDAASHWQFGALCEWTTTQGTVHTDYEDNSVDFDVEASGLGLRGVVGWRF